MARLFGFWRALVALQELPALAQVSVDTVERGQVGRKPNVAVTRARQQLFLLGKELVLSRGAHHAALLARVRAAGGWVAAVKENN